MAPIITPVRTSPALPLATTVVVIGGGIVGLMAALVLAERGIPVTVIEKGRIAGEQSSRNLGWVRKTNRGIADLPLATESDRLWAAMPERVGAEVGYRQAGILYVARSEAEMAPYEAWIASVRELGLDSRLLSPGEIDALVPGGAARWAGGICTPSDGRAEPTLAASAIARAAMAKGAVIVEHCAAQALARSGGAVSGVVTERGEIGCEEVLLAGGIWSRRFLGNLGIALPTLPLVASVLRTTPMEGPTDMAVGGPDFSFRKRLDGGFTITQRGALQTSITPDHLRIGLHYLPTLRAQWHNLRLGYGGDFPAYLALGRRWRREARAPFERFRTMDPPVNEGLIQEAMRNLVAAWPGFAAATIEQRWAGMIDVTPDSHPVIARAPSVPGLTIASGFSGHGFGTAPAAGTLAADLVIGAKPILDPAPYRLDRF